MTTNGVCGGQYNWPMTTRLLLGLFLAVCLMNCAGQTPLTIPNAVGNVAGSSTSTKQSPGSGVCNLSLHSKYPITTTRYQNPGSMVLERCPTEDDNDWFIRRGAAHASYHRNDTLGTLVEYDAFEVKIHGRGVLESFQRDGSEILVHFVLGSHQIGWLATSLFALIQIADLSSIPERP
jgi:hypothetical protein